jgi:hypothetical protein
MILLYPAFEVSSRWDDRRQPVIAAQEIRDSRQQRRLQSEHRVSPILVWRNIVPSAGRHDGLLAMKNQVLLYTRSRPRRLGGVGQQALIDQHRRMPVMRVLLVVVCPADHFAIVPLARADLDAEG